MALGDCMVACVWRGQGSPMPDPTASSQLWWTHCRAWLSTSANMVTLLRKYVEKEHEKQQQKHQGQWKKRRKRWFRHQSTDSSAVYGKDPTGAHEYFLKEVHIPGEPVEEQVYPEMIAAHGKDPHWSRRKCEEAGAEERSNPNSPSALHHLGQAIR